MKTISLFSLCLVHSSHSVACALCVVQVTGSLSVNGVDLINAISTHSKCALPPSSLLPLTSHRPLPSPSPTLHPPPFSLIPR
jgi:hypothetical protein